LNNLFHNYLFFSAPQGDADSSLEELNDSLDYMLTQMAATQPSAQMTDSRSERHPDLVAADREIERVWDIMQRMQKGEEIREEELEGAREVDLGKIARLEAAEFRKRQKKYAAPTGNSEMAEGSSSMDVDKPEPPVRRSRRPSKMYDSEEESSQASSRESESDESSEPEQEEANENGRAGVNRKKRKSNEEDQKPSKRPMKKHRRGSSGSKSPDSNRKRLPISARRTQAAAGQKKRTKTKSRARDESDEDTVPWVPCFRVMFRLSCERIVFFCPVRWRR
jgi:hypothetical protein